jgi:hypothetical protein
MACLLKIVGPVPVYVKCIHTMVTMRLKHAHAIDLNLLGPLHALLDQRHVTKAAMRCGMSQPAMSRALARLRRIVGDELLIGRGDSPGSTTRWRSAAWNAGSRCARRSIWPPSS